MNVVGTSDGKFVEIQGTGEESTFSYDELQELLDMARNGLSQLAEMQSAALDGIEWAVRLEIQMLVDQLLPGQ